MSKSKLPYITLDGREYQIVVTKKDIVLQGIHDDRELTNGWMKLMDECWECLRYNMRDQGVMGTPRQSWVDERADENLYDYVLSNYKDAVIVQHNVN